MLRVLDPHQLDASERAAVSLYSNRRLAEQWPGDPVKSIEESVGELRFVPRFLDTHQWAEWSEDGARMLARGAIGVMRTEDNPHVAEIDIYVVPDQRRRGHGSRLLSAIVDVARAEGRTLLLATTDRDIPSGRAFMQCIGAERGLTSYTSQLAIAEINHDEIRLRRERGRSRATGYRLDVWLGAYPAARVREMVGMKDLINAAPTGSLDVEDFEWTVEQIREYELSLTRQDIERLTVVALHERTDRIVGFSEVFWNRSKPGILTQGDTAVHASHRNKGIASWLKVEMFHAITERLPGASLIRTSNAASNTAMLAINHKLGFRRFKTWTVWQVQLTQVEGYLASRRA
jgi:GNAT superfamily N-acetyltransferase